MGLDEVLTIRKNFTMLLNILQGFGLGLIVWFDTSSCRGVGDVKGVGCGGMDWADLVGKVAGRCECGNELSGSIKFGEFLY